MTGTIRHKIIQVNPQLRKEHAADKGVNLHSKKEEGKKERRRRQLASQHYSPAP
jgi:hypothetical protein